MMDWNSRVNAEWSDDSRTFTLWNSHTGRKELENFEAITSVVISPDSKIAAAHSKTAITLWDIETGEGSLRYNLSPSNKDEHIKILTEDYYV